MTKELRVVFEGVTYTAEVTSRTTIGKDGSPYTYYSVSIKIGVVTLTSSFYQTVGMAISELIPWKRNIDRPKLITNPSCEET